jgi:hypothetical protein
MRPDTAPRRLIFESANQTKAIVLRTTTEKDNKKQKHNQNSTVADANMLKRTTNYKLVNHKQNIQS